MVFVVSVATKLDFRDGVWVLVCWLLLLLFCSFGLFRHLLQNPSGGDSIASSLVPDVCFCDWPFLHGCAAALLFCIDFHHLPSLSNL